MTHGFDDVWRNARGEEFCRTTDAEAVTSCARISRGHPDLVASCEEGCLRQHARTRRGGVGKEWKVAGKGAGCEVRVDMRDGVEGV